MQRKYLVTTRRDCDLRRLEAALGGLGVQLDKSGGPMPLGEDEQAVRVQVEGGFPDEARRLPGVVRVNPISKMQTF